MLSADQINIIVDKYIGDLYDDLEREVIADIARRVKKTTTYTETAELMAKAMRKQGYSTAKIQSEVMKLLNADPAFRKLVAEETKQYKQGVKQRIKETVTQAQKSGDTLVAEAGRMAWNEDLRMWAAGGINLAKDNSLIRLIEAFKSQTKGQLRNITRTAAFKGTQLGTVGVINAYQRSLDLAVLKISTGTFSQQKAIQDVIDEMTNLGLRTIDYASGRSYHIDTAARMCVRTACSQLAGKMTERNIQKTGVDLVYVDAHVGARPSHAVWQGQVYYYSRFRPVPGYDYFVDATDYGDAQGLKGINCTHNFFPYWEGSAIPEFKDHDPVHYNGADHTYYEATQELRKQERAIRKTKRAIEANKAVGYDTKDLNAKLRAQNQNYKQFKQKMGLKV